MKLYVAVAYALLIGTAAKASGDVETLRVEVIDAAEKCVTVDESQSWEFKSIIWNTVKSAKAFRYKDQLDDLFATVGLECVNRGSKIERVWVGDAFKYAKITEANRHKAKKLFDQLEAEERAARVHEQVELTRRVHAACVLLESSDPVAAYTNQLCVNSFSSNGLPVRTAKTPTVDVPPATELLPPKEIDG